MNNGADNFNSNTNQYNGYSANNYGGQNYGYYGNNYAGNQAPYGRPIYNHQPYSSGYSNYNYYQRLYNMFGGHNPIVEKEFAEISRRGLITGALILGVFLMQILFSYVISALPFADLYRSNTAFSMSFGILAQGLYMFLPFMIAYIFSKPEEKKVINVFNKPKTWKLYILGVSAGLALCLLGNTATSIFSAYLQSFGITFYSGSEGMEIPTGVISVLIFVANTAIMPALFEEFAFRGVIMQPLRKYGDWFAILTSAFCFAIVHANMVQIPFAFIAGISLGYFCIKTKSIWTSVTIHFLNNLLSIIFSVYFELKPNGSIFVYYVVVASLILIGAVAMLVFRSSCPIKTKKDATAIGKNKTLKRAAFVTAPTMICAIFFAVFTSVSLTQLVNPLGLVILVAGIVALSVLLVRWTYKIQAEKSINHRRMYTASMVLAVFSCTFILMTTFGIV